MTFSRKNVGLFVCNMHYLLRPVFTFSFLFFFFTCVQSICLGPGQPAGFGTFSLLAEAANEVGSIPLTTKAPLPKDETGRQFSQ